MLLLLVAMRMTQKVHGSLQTTCWSNFGDGLKSTCWSMSRRWNVCWADRLWDWHTKGVPYSQPWVECQSESLCWTE